MRTDTEEFQDKQNKWGERGRVHGTIYRIAFGESCDDVTIVAEGFGIIGLTIIIYLLISKCLHVLGSYDKRLYCQLRG